MKMKYFKIFLLNVLCISAVVSLFGETNSPAQKGLNRLQGKTVIVVGASKGIGKSIAETFAREGAEVLLVSRDKKLLERNVLDINAAGGKASYEIGDTKSYDDMNRMIKVALERYGKIDILVFNTGIYPKARVEEMTLQQWHNVMDTNLTGAFMATQAVIPVMKKQGGGKVLYTSSVSGPDVALPFRAHYCASKAGLEAFMKVAAVEHAKHQIVFNSIRPGLIMTEGVEALGQQHINDMKKAIPMGYIDRPQSIANAMLFLASDESTFTTGQSLVIDGGQMLPESQFELSDI